MPELAVDREQSTAGARYKFVLCQHSLQSAPVISEQLRDCDIIAIESVGGSDEQRRTLEASYTALLSSLMPSNKRESLYTDSALGFHDHFETEVLYPLAGTNKRVVLLDVNEGTPEYVLKVKFETAQAEVLDAMSRLAPNAELKALVVQEAVAFADQAKARELRVVEQLESLSGQTTKEGSPAVIGVVSGMMHTPEEAAISKTHPTERILVDVARQEPGETPRLRYLNQAALQLNVDPDTPLDEELVDRMLLADLYALFNTYPAGDVETEIIDRMPHEQVQQLLEQLDRIRTTTNKVWRKPKPAIIVQEMASALRRNQEPYVDGAN